MIDRPTMHAVAELLGSY